MQGCTKTKLHIVQVIEDSKRHAQNTTEKIWKRLCSGAGAEQQAVNISVQLENFESPKKTHNTQCTGQGTEHNAHGTMQLHRAEHRAQCTMRNAHLHNVQGRTQSTKQRTQSTMHRAEHRAQSGELAQREKQ